MLPGTPPWVLKEGDSLKVGQAELEFKGNTLALKDLYTDKSLAVRVKKVEVRPYPPVYVPKKVTDYLILEFDPLLFEEDKDLWFTAPYDLAIRVRGRVTAYLSPFTVKYTLYGPTTEGVVCRYHRTEVMEEPEDTEYALVKVKFRVNKPKQVDKLVIPVTELDMFAEDGKIFYEVVEATIGDLINVELKNVPPVEAKPIYPAERSVSVISRIMSGYRMRW